MSTIASPPALRRRLIFLLLLCLAGATLALAQSASAAVPGINLATTVSPFNSNNKSATVSCPAGDELLGLGGGIDAGAGQVVVDDWMQLDPTRGAVRGVESTPFTSSWTAGATGICAAPLAGRTQVIATSPSSSDDKYVTATCPTGTQLVAGGADILGGKGNVIIEDMVPDLSTNSMIVLAHEHTGTTDSWQDRASVTCATPLPGMERKYVPSARDSTDSKTVSVSCSPGKVLTGVGAETVSSGGQVGIESIEPNAFINGATVTATEMTPTSLDWEEVAYGLCADA